MTETNTRMKRLIGLAAKAFILASAAAVFLPMPQYARSLSDGQYIVWLARAIWVLMLTLGVGVVLLLVGFLVKKMQNKTRTIGKF